MTTFDDREKGFERKFIHDQELQFKATARRNKLLGLWAAGLLGYKGDQAEEYAKNIAVTELDHKETLVEHLLKDFSAASITVSAKDILVEMERLIPIAQEQILGSSSN